MFASISLAFRRLLVFSLPTSPPVRGGAPTRRRDLVEGAAAAPIAAPHPNF